MKRKSALFSAALLCLCGLLAAACVQQQITRADSRGFYAGGRFRTQIAVSSPLILAGAGYFTTAVPADVLLSPPSATFRFAAYGEGESGPLARAAHVIASELPSPGWRWERESMARTETLSYSQLSAGGRNWTVQIFPVLSVGDWFSRFWTEKGRTVPDFWLAEHWSATPDDDLRIVVEYREPAPACMREYLKAFVKSRENRDYAPLRGKEAARRCGRDVEEFSRRADAVVNLAGLPQAEAQATSGTAPGTETALPDGRPDMRKLVGVAEIVRNDASDMR
ncbi:MAG: DUF4851 domain-containing protein [Desulfovibrio sp.]|jgi:hypothetical protein|nr:DUF4851 domain-containing protein [Desulfovibrio sp.]